RHHRAAEHHRRDHRRHVALGRPGQDVRHDRGRLHPRDPHQRVRDHEPAAVLAERRGRLRPHLRRLRRPVPQTGDEPHLNTPCLAAGRPTRGTIMLRAIKKVAVLALAGLTLAACATEPEPAASTGGGAGGAAQERVVMLLNDQFDPYYLTLVKGAEEKAKELGVDFSWQ